MEKIAKIQITFHDIVNVLMWDDEYNKENVKSKVPCGRKISYWLARAFTLSNIKRYADKSQYALAIYYKELLPDVEIKQRNLQDFYLAQIKLIKNTLKDNPVYGALDISTFTSQTTVTVNALPCPPVLMFIRINILCNEAHIELRKLYQCGNITKSEYFQRRRKLFKPFNRFRSEFSLSVYEAGRLARALVENKTGE